MPMKKLKEYLDSNKVKYTCITHSPAYTAQEIAQSAHVSGDTLAKTVIIKLNGKMAMVVLPATMKVNFAMLQKELGNDSVVLADEFEFKDKFPGCEPGAMPPFGNLYDMEVYVAKRLSHDETIAFNAGSHTELIQLSYKDFADLAKPTVIAMP